MERRFSTISKSAVKKVTLLENPFPLSNIYTSYFPLHRIQGEAPSPQFWNPLRMPSPSDLERINQWHFYALPNFGTTNLFVIQILQIYSYQRPSEVPRMCANHVAAGALPQIPLGKLTYQWGGEKPPPHQLGCMGANPTPAVSPLGLSVPHPHDFLTPLQFYFSIEICLSQIPQGKLWRGACIYGTRYVHSATQRAGPSAPKFLWSLY